jgi:hypothetical protein
MMIDAATGSKIESCLDAARACSEALAYVRLTPELASDRDLANGLSEAARVTSLTADCLERVPDIREMVLRVCVEVAERVALSCASRHDQPELLVCGEALAACAAICMGVPEIDMAAASGNGAHAGAAAH